MATEMAGHDVSPGAQPPFGASSAIQSWLFCTWPTYSPRTTVNRAYSAIGSPTRDGLHRVA